jgi:hypothetical protein
VVHHHGAAVDQHGVGAPLVGALFLEETLQGGHEGRPCDPCDVRVRYGKIYDVWSIAMVPPSTNTA